jgi:hypothetical protein
MKKLALTIIATTVILGSMQTVSANQERRSPPPSFEQMDSDGNGELSKDEIKGPILDQFDELDADGNGTLSESEWPDAPPPPPAQ